MSLIETTAPADATGEVAALYQRLQGRGRKLPNYARIFCHRPQLMAPISTLQDAIRSPLEPRIWALVSLAAARASAASYCSLAFANKLIANHFSESEVQDMVTGQGPDPLSVQERAAYDFAARVALDAARIDAGEIEHLRRAGFDDVAIFDLAAAAAWRCFFARLPEALGAAPDRSLGDLPAELLSALLTGRGLEEPDLQQSSAKSSTALQACAPRAEYSGHATCGNSQPRHVQNNETAD